MRTDAAGSAGPPYPTPVQFDQAAAEALLNSLRAAIATLGTSSSTDQKSANQALDGWKGAWADQFAGGSLVWMASESGRILNGMLALQSQISHAMEAAKQLQAQHNLANQRWAEAQHHQPPS